MPSSNPETHLGKALFVSIEDGEIRLRQGAHVVILEAETLEAFMTWLKALRERAQKEGPSAVE